MSGNLSFGVNRGFGSGQVTRRCDAVQLLAPPFIVTVV